MRLITVAGIAGFLAIPAALELLVSEAAPAQAAQKPLSPDLSRRTDDCGACIKWAEELGPEHFASDPHTAPCATCHHPHTARKPESWRQTCQSEGCHPRAWTKTVFHRVPDATVFMVCTNCHQPHTWRLDGQNCRGCHDPQTMEPVAVTNSGTFSHEIHSELECASCHTTEKTHSRVTIEAPGDCQSCHHLNQKRDCASCHASSPPVLQVSTPMSFAKKPAVNRRLSFDHSYHDFLDCSDCHGATADRNPVECRSCHEEHHQEGAACASCHRTPASEAHTLSVHYQSCDQSGCHVREVPFSWESRDCVVCHTDKKEHYPDSNCAYCHFSSKGGK